MEGMCGIGVGVRVGWRGWCATGMVVNAVVVVGNFLCLRVGVLGILGLGLVLL